MTLRMSGRTRMRRWVRILAIAIGLGCPVTEPGQGNLFIASARARPPEAAATEAGVGANDPVIAAAGDIACAPDDTDFHDGRGTATSCRQRATSDLLATIVNLAAVLTLGDHQYDDGSLAQFRGSYDPAWGRFKFLTHPSPGNHERGGDGYFAYFGAAAGDPAKGYYSFDLGAWHIIAVNSNDACRLILCGAHSAQLAWLREDLAKHRTVCTLAYWHHPRFSSGLHGDHAALESVWETLYAFGVDVVLTGHDHSYERLEPLDARGRLDPVTGIRSFVVGTGGRSHFRFGAVKPESAARNDDTFGVLKLTLHPRSYEWEFVPEAGKTFTDHGTGRCH